MPSEISKAAESVSDAIVEHLQGDDTHQKKGIVFGVLGCGFVAIGAYQFFI